MSLMDCYVGVGIGEGIAWIGRFRPLGLGLSAAHVVIHWLKLSSVELPDEI